jgi:hypothetical protein
MVSKSGAFQEMHLREIEERARTFHRLAHSREYAKKRILQNLRWEFEFSPVPALDKKVDEIVNRVYGA